MRTTKYWIVKLTLFLKSRLSWPILEWISIKDRLPIPMPWTRSTLKSISLVNLSLLTISTAKRICLRRMTVTSMDRSLIYFKSIITTRMNSNQVAIYNVLIDFQRQPVRICFPLSKCEWMRTTQLRRKWWISLVLASLSIMWIKRIGNSSNS